MFNCSDQDYNTITNFFFMRGLEFLDHPSGYGFDYDVNYVRYICVLHYVCLYLTMTFSVISS